MVESEYGLSLRIGGDVVAQTNMCRFNLECSAKQQNPLPQECCLEELKRLVGNQEEAKGASPYLELLNTPSQIHHTPVSTPKGEC